MSEPESGGDRTAHWFRAELAPIAVAITIAASPFAAAEEIHLASGDRITATVVERTETHLVLDHAVLGRLEVPRSELVEVAEGAVGADGAVSAAVFQDAPPATEPEWKSNFVLGLGSSFGNSDAQSFHAGARSLREADDQRTALDGHFYYGARDGDRTENKFTAGILHDWLLPDSPWLVFATGRYDYDEFQSWEHRVGAHGGVGYHLIDDEDFDLTLRAGAGVVKEFGSVDEDLRPEALLGGDLAWRISERQTLVAGSTVYPDLGDVGEYRAVSYARWAMRLDEESNMSLNAGVEHEYQSRTDPGIDKNDFRIVAGLQFDF